jgi:iron complex transport system substrate-binding protein
VTGPVTGLVNRAALVTALLLAACTRTHAPPGPRVVRDGMGREVALPAKVTRVVSLAPSSTEILYAVGAGPLMVGVDRYSDYPPEVAKLEKVGADIDPSLERVVALRPDVVFTANTANNQRTVESLERAGLRVYVSAASGLDAIFEDTARIADAVGRGEEGRRLAAALRARLDVVHARMSGLPTVRTLVVVWPEPLLVAGRGSHVEQMIALAGGENVAADSDKPYPTYSVERVLARAPEVVVVGSHAVAEDPVAKLEAALPALGAVQRHRVYGLDGNLLFRPGPRLVDGVEALARVLHP